MPSEWRETRVSGARHSAADGLYTARFPSGWQRHRLYDLASWVNGMAFRDFHFTEGGRPIIRIAEIKNGISGQTNFTVAEYDDCYYVRDGDMLFSWSGQPETSIDVFYWHGPDGWLNQHIFKIEPSPSCDRRFFYYLLRYLKRNFIGIARNKQTTGLGHVTKTDLERLSVAIPDGLQQRSIARILCSLDDKIELNRKMNETLEQMARAIFKSWFVDFLPFRDKGMVESPRGKIPKGWRVQKLSALCTPQYGYTAAASVEPIGPKLLRVTDINKQNWVDWVTVPHCLVAPKDHAKYRLNVGDILVARMADPGKSAIFEDEVVDAVFASYLVRLKLHNRKQGYFVYGYLNSRAYWEYCEGAKGGAAVQPSMNASVLTDVDLVVPDDDLVVESFAATVGPLRMRIVANLRETATLAAIRDALLPKLMSGEVRIEN